MTIFGLCWVLAAVAALADDSCELLQTAETRQKPNARKPQLPKEWDGLASLCYAPYALCANAICEQPVDGYATCKCNLEAAGVSILPTNTSGAPKVEGVDVNMCEQMQSGEIYSTFGFGISNPMPGVVWAKCPPQTSFAYCWGAQCKKLDEETAACDCPITKSLNSNVDQFLMTNEKYCDELLQQGESPCDTSKFTFNSGPEWMFKILLVDHPVLDDEGTCYDYNSTR